jgi:hypothetical protein
MPQGENGVTGVLNHVRREKSARERKAVKKKLLVILGAGSSISRGMPSVPALDEHMSEWGNGWALMRGFPDYYAILGKSFDTYLGSGPTGPRPALNYEKMLGGMVALAHWMTPPPWGDPLRQAACDGEPPPSLHFPNPTLSGHAPYGATVMLADQLQHLLVQLGTAHAGALQKARFYEHFCE